MPNYFSDHYTSTVGGTSIADPRPFAAPGLSHSNLKYKRGTVTCAAAVTNAEQLRFFPLKSNDRLIQLFLSTPSLTGTTMTAELGCYDTVENGDAVIDINLFGTVTDSPLDDLTVAVARVDCFAIGPLEDEDRGKKLYELIDEGLGTTVYDNDPNKLIDIVLTMNTETAVTVGAEFVLEAIYSTASS